MIGSTNLQLLWSVPILCGSVCTKNWCKERTELNEWQGHEWPRLVLFSSSSCLVQYQYLMNSLCSLLQSVSARDEWIARCPQNWPLRHFPVASKTHTWWLPSPKDEDWWPRSADSNLILKYDFTERSAFTHRDSDYKRRNKTGKS